MRALRSDFAPRWHVTACSPTLPTGLTSPVFFSAKENLVNRPRFPQRLKPPLSPASCVRP